MNFVYLIIEEGSPHTIFQGRRCRGIFTNYHSAKESIEEYHKALRKYLIHILTSDDYADWDRDSPVSLGHHDEIQQKMLNDDPSLKEGLVYRVFPQDQNHSISIYRVKANTLDYKDFL